MPRSETRPCVAVLRSSRCEIESVRRRKVRLVIVHERMTHRLRTLHSRRTNNVSVVDLSRTFLPIAAF